MAASAPSPARTPIRTCIGCRERAYRGDLLRIVAVGSQVHPDPRANLSGRGAWLHPACLGAAERRRAFGRALRITGPVDLEALRAWVSP